jgi:hypothetical protein
MTSHEYTQENPAISYDLAYAITGRHLSAPGVELDAAIAQGDVLVIDRKGQPYEPLNASDQIETKSLMIWLGY